MNCRKLFFWVVCVFVVALICYLLVFELNGDHVQRTTSDEALIMSSENNQRGEKPPRFVEEGLESHHSSAESMIESMVARAMFLHENSEIRFFGRVIDQFGDGVVGARVEFVIRKLGDERGSSRGEDVVWTDQEGRFSVEGGYGVGLVIENIQRDGYEGFVAESERSFSFHRTREDRHNPEESQPELFQLWKLTNESDRGKVKYGDFTLIMIPDGRPYYVDILNKDLGEVSKENSIGDFRISILSGRRGNEKIYEWEYRVEGILGGLVEADGEFPFLAPESGYLNEVKRDFSGTGQPDWQYRPLHSYFLRSRDGELYGYLLLDVYSRYNDGAAVHCRYIINEGGSRILETDSKQMQRIMRVAASVIAPKER